MSIFEEEYFEKAYGGDYRKRTPSRKLAYYLDAVRETKPSGALLDIGCAYGLFLSVASRHFHVEGCDTSAYAVSRANDLFPGLKIYQAGIETLQPGRTFDVVTCFDILEHVKELDRGLETIRGLLERDGVLALTVPVYDGAAGCLVRLLDKDETHHWREGRAFWRNLLVRNGFRIVKDVGLWRCFLLGRYYVFFGGRAWRNFSPAILLIGKKDDDLHRSAGL